MKTLFLAWEDPKSMSWFPIGRLTYDGKYQFVYTKGAVEAQTKFGFQPLISFPDLSKIYTSTQPFPFFSNRLMKPSRPEYKNYIQWLNIPESEDNPITILSRSGGRKVTDNYEIFPCPEPDKNGLYHIHFFADGLKYLNPKVIENINQLKADECLYLEEINQLKIDEYLYLEKKFETLFHKRLLILCTKNHDILGYCPCYVEDTFRRNHQNQKIKVQIERINPVPAPLQLRLLCNITAKWNEEFRPFSSSEFKPINHKNC